MTERKITFKAAKTITEENKEHILSMLREEGFTQEQLEQMPLEDVIKLYARSIRETIPRELAPLYRALENPQLAAIINPYIKKLREDLEKTLNELEGKLPKKEKSST